MSSANRFRFRAWHKPSRRMAYDVQKEYDTIAGVEFDDGNEPFENCFNSYLRDDDYDVMQSTGLLDKNGKEIFEGDILAHRYSGMSDSEKSFIGVVEYHADKIIEIGFENSETRFTGYVLKCDNRPIIDEYYYSNICHLAEHEVVGNRFENPELLEAGE